MRRSLALAVLLCAASARAQDKTSKLVFSRRVDCRGGASDGGIPNNSAIREFFAVPAKNLAFISRHLSKAAAAGCHSACYYRVVKAR